MKEVRYGVFRVQGLRAPKRAGADAEAPAAARCGCKHLLLCGCEIS